MFIVVAVIIVVIFSLFPAGRMCHHASVRNSGKWFEHYRNCTDA